MTGHIHLGSLQNRARHASAQLVHREVHLWSASLEELGLETTAMDIMSADERERMLRYRFEIDRHAFARSRVLTRALLAGYMDTTAEAIRFSYNRYGKPRLTNPCHRTLNFNLSHTSGQLLVAITWDSDIGVDVERLHVRSDHASAIRSCLHFEETEVLTRTEPREHNQLLFRFWTHKEAFLKAVGVGLSLSRNEAKVTLLDREYSVVRALISSREVVLPCRDIKLNSDYVAALAGSQVGSVTCFVI